MMFAWYLLKTTFSSASWSVSGTADSNLPTRSKSCWLGGNENFLSWIGWWEEMLPHVIANDHLYDRIDLTHYKMFGKNGIVWWHVTVLYFTAASALPTLANWQKSSLATTPFESTSPSKTSSSSSPTCRWIDRITFWEQIQCFDH